MANRVSHPGRIWVFGQRAAIQEDLTEYAKGFMENYYQAGLLDDLLWKIALVRLGNAEGNAVGVGPLLC